MIKYIKIKGWKGIKNQIDLNFGANIYKSPSKMYLYNTNVNKKCFNKLAITGSNSSGKTSILESLEQIYYYMLMLKDQQTFEEVLEKSKKYTKKLIFEMKFSEDMFTYVYKFFLDNENNIIKDTIEVFDLKDQKILELNSQNFYKYKLIFNWEELESENWNKEIQTKILNLINEKFSVEGIKNRKFYQQLKKITANNISESFFNVIKKDLNKYSVVLLSFYKEQFENKINDSNNDRGNNLLSFYLISMMNWTVKKYSNYDNKRLTTNNEEEILSLMKENQKQIINFVVQVDKNLADIKFVKVGEEIKIIYVDSKGKEYDFRKYASTGTIQSYALALWIFFMTKDSNNKLILIDEIDTSLNPWILQKLLNLSFCKNVQMIFTFHNVGVMNFIDNCLYREQVLILDKYNSGKIGLTPISKLWGKNIIKSSELFNYMEGVYGGQPNK